MHKEPSTSEVFAFWFKLIELQWSKDTFSSLSLSEEFAAEPRDFE
jgi:hypothetical protein